MVVCGFGAGDWGLGVGAGGWWSVGWGFGV